jgi:hypothetical protein
MNTRRLFVVFQSVAVCGVALCLTGCPKDPNKNTFGGNGGSNGGGGTSGTQGGGGSTGMGPIVGSPVVTFNTSTEGFVIEAFHDLAQTNLGDPASNANPPPSIAFDGTQGNPDSGSLVIMAPYSGASQYVDIQKSIQTMPQNWMGKTMHVRIKVSSGTFRGGVQLYAKTGMAFVFGGTYINFAAGSNWQEFTLNVSAPMTIIPNYDPTQVVSFGLQLNTGSAGAGSTPVTFNVDSFSIFPPIAGTGNDAASDSGGDAANDAGGDAPRDAVVDAAAPDTSDAASDTVVAPPDSASDVSDVSGDAAPADVAAEVATD